MIIAPDDNAAFTRYGVVTLGDGNEYRCARAGIGERGDRLRELIDRMDACENPRDVWAIARELFHTAFGVFYNRTRIDSLLELDAIGAPEIRQIIAVVLDMPDAKKNDCSGERLTATNGQPSNALPANPTEPESQNYEV